MIRACLFAPKIEKAPLEDLQVGDVIEGTGEARKIRIQLEGRGKSGGGGVSGGTPMSNANLLTVRSGQLDIHDYERRGLCQRNSEARDQELHCGD